MTPIEVINEIFAPPAMIALAPFFIITLIAAVSIAGWKSGILLTLALWIIAFTLTTYVYWVCYTF